ncbi:MAG: HAMP domain-containing histidine kinase, partial [Pedobacter sp.]
GIGFDDNYSSRLFDIFYRQHTETAYKGTGIGLAICKKIAEHHGGGILAQNISEGGALFKVYLPM